MELLKDLLHEISCERDDKESIYLENLIENIIYGLGNDISDIENEYHCKITVFEEKHNQLQYTFYVSITSYLVKGELHLEIEDGINSGTELNSYSFNLPIEPDQKYSTVLKDVILDESYYKNVPKYFKAKAQAVLNRDKHLIFEFERKNSYDNYVTGGNSKLEPKGLWTKLHLEYIYEDIEVDSNITKL